MTNKKKNVIQITVVSAVVLAVGAGGFFIGKSFQNQEAVPAAVSDAHPDTTEKQEKEETTDQIAIVNLDEGITVRDEQINYAAKLLTNLNENFSLAGLEAARNGVNDGTYGAYIIIPAAFSESVTSLNDTPRKAKIEFGVNEKLDSETKENVVLDTMSFLNRLNHNLSYMYTNTILKEFHDTQDAARKVMANDKKDAEVIQQIKPADLVEMVPAPQITPLENNTDYLEVQEYVEKNSKLVSEVDNQYEEYIAKGRSDYEELSGQGDQLVTEWESMDELVRGINLIKDDAGNALYADGVSESSKVMESHNKMLAELGKSISDTTRKAEDDLAALGSGYEEQIRAYNKILDKNRKEKQEELTNAYKYPEITVEDGELKIFGETVDLLYISTAYPEVISWEEMWKARLLLMEEYLKDNEVYIAQLEEYIQTLENDVTDTSIIEPLPSRFTPDWEELEKTGFTVGDMFLTYVFNNLLSEEFRQDQAQIGVDLDALSTGINEAIGRNMLSGEEYDKQSTAAMESFTDYKDEIKVADEDNETSTSSLTKELDRVKKNLDSNTASRGESLITPLDTANLKEILNEQIIQPVAANAETVKSDILQQYSEEKEQYRTYNQLLGEYDPLKYIDKNKISETVKDMQSNGSDLQEDISNYSRSQSDYSGKVYATAGDNINSIIRQVEDAQKKSEAAVSNGLSQVQQIKGENSEVNQALMLDVTQKLPYTRLGSLEYTQVYEFIANPLSILKVNEKGGEIIEKKDIDAAAAGAPAPKEAEKPQSGVRDVIIAASIAGTMILLLAMFSLAGYFRKKNANHL